MPTNLQYLTNELETLKEDRDRATSDIEALEQDLEYYQHEIIRVEAEIETLKEAEDCNEHFNKKGK